MGGEPAPRTRCAHASLAVRALDPAVRFYGDAFAYRELFRAELTEQIEGMTGVAGVSCSLAQLQHPDGSVLELIAFAGVPEERTDDAPVRVGHGHVAFAVEDLEAALDRVVALGARRLGSVVGFPDGEAVYLREPSGSVFELSTEAGEALRVLARGSAGAEPPPGASR